jgi:M6 family metalloprotease-like protein
MLVIQNLLGESIMDRWLQGTHGGWKVTLTSVFILVFCLAFSNFASAMPAYPGPVYEQQPDGSSIELRIKGDEHFNWLEDANGFTVIQQGDWFQYAQLDSNGRLIATGLNVGKSNPQAAGLQQGILPSSGIRAQSALTSPDMGIGIDAVPPFGNIKNLVVLIRFSDHAARSVPNETNVGKLMNSVNPDVTFAPTGSVRGLYLENSYGQMTLDSTIALWVTVPNTESYYANGNSGLSTFLHPALRNALDQVDAQPGINFDDFDTDNDNYIDSITFLHSGYAAEFGGNDSDGTPYTSRIWSHRWSLLASGSAWTSSTGVRVTDYHISPALWGTSGTAIGRIGVIAHETGHFFGLPDLYDTDNGAGEGIGSWGLMANSWGFSGNQYCPPHMSAWSKINLGWSTPATIAGPGQYALNEVEFNNEIYRIDAGYPNNEYLLIENRQPSGFEYCMPQGGLAIWHIDDSAGFNTQGMPGQGGWPTNGNHYRVALLQADGNYDLENGNDRGDSGDMHHATGVDAIGPGPGGHPNTDAYQGGTITVTGHVIDNISSSSSNMTFCLNGCSGLLAPSGLNATATSSTNIDLVWSDNSPDETGFRIETSPDGSSWSLLANTAANATAYSHSGLSANSTHHYRVHAFNLSDTSGWSNSANATTFDVPPADPSGLVATSTGTDQIDLVWNDNSSNETGFRIERALNDVEVEFTEITTVGANVENYSNTGLSSSTTYYYRVYAIAGAVDSAGFTADNATTDDPPLIIPYYAYADQFGSGSFSGDYTDTHTDNGVVQWIEEKVSGGRKRNRTTFMGHFWRFNIGSGDVIRVYANAYQNGSGDGDNFDFTWSDNDSNYDDSGHELFTVDVNETSTSNTEFGTIPNTVSGEVWIRVIDSDRTGGNSTLRDRINVDQLYIEVENFGPPTIPADPTGLTVNSSGFTYIDFTWNDNANNEDFYRVEGSDDGLGGWTEIAVLPVNTTSHSETGLANGVTRHYRVRASNNIGFSGYSNTDSGTTLEPETPPNDPVIGTATANGPNSITVTWTHVSSNEDGFRIRRSTDDATWGIVAAIGVTNSWEDTTVVGDTTYFYQVQAFNSSDSGWSASASATTPPGPSTIDLLASGFKNKGKKNFTLNWSPADGGNVDVLLDGGVAASTSDNGSYTLSTNLKGGGSHTLQVCETDGDLVCSNEAVVTF